MRASLTVCAVPSCWALHGHLDVRVTGDCLDDVGRHIQLKEQRHHRVAQVVQADRLHPRASPSRWGIPYIHGL